MAETVILDERNLVLMATPPSAKSHSVSWSFLRALEIGNDEASPGFEHPRDFGESSGTKWLLNYGLAARDTSLIVAARACGVTVLSTMPAA